MKKMRLVFFLTVVGVLGFLSYRFVRKLLELFKLAKTLPEYLRDMIGEKPSVFCNYNLKVIELRIGLSKEVKDREKNLHEVIKNYIDDFYPDLSTMNMEINIYEKSDDKHQTVSDD